MVRKEKHMQVGVLKVDVREDSNYKNAQENINKKLVELKNSGADNIQPPQFFGKLTEYAVVVIPYEKELEVDIPSDGSGVGKDNEGDGEENSSPSI